MIPLPDEDLSESADRPDPDAVGRYEVLGRLERGETGEVFLVHDDDLEREVAAKVVVDGDDPALLETFVREARITGRLDHPNIVPVHEIGRTADGRPFFTMRRVAGETLEARIERAHDPGSARTGEERARLVPLLEAFLKVCDAIAFAHDRGVIHRGLDPASVMVGGFGEVVVMDWGRARAADDDGPDPAPSSSERADIFDLGAILYRILTGTRPFPGEAGEASESGETAGALVPPRARAPDRAIPWELEAVVLRAMARDPAERYPSVAALRTDVVGFIEGTTLGAARYAPWRRLAKWAGRNRLAIAATLLGLAVTAVAGWSAIGSLRSSNLVDDARVEARAALADERPADAVAAAERGLAIADDDDELAAILVRARDLIAARRARTEATLTRADRRSALTEALRPIERRLARTRPYLAIEHVAIRRHLDALEASLAPLLALTDDERHRADPRLHVALGIAWWTADRPDRAEGSLRAALALDPESAVTRCYLVRLAVAATVLDGPSAARDAELVALVDGIGRDQLPGLSPRDRRLLAVHRARASGDPVEAIRLAREGVIEHAGELGAEELHLAIALSTAEPDARGAALDAAIALRPHWPTARRMRAAARLARGETAAALDDLRRARAVVPADARAALDARIAELEGGG